jgi:hypothetical protein
VDEKNLSVRHRNLTRLKIMKLNINIYIRRYDVNSFIGTHNRCTRKCWQTTCGWFIECALHIYIYMYGCYAVGVGNAKTVNLEKIIIIISAFTLQQWQRRCAWNVTIYHGPRISLPIISSCVVFVFGAMLFNIKCSNMCLKANGK